MAESRLKRELRTIVREYGLDQVDRSLLEIRSDLAESTKVNEALSLGGLKGGNLKGGKKRERTNAITYVEKMNLAHDKKAVLRQLATNFEERTFLPTGGDLQNFSSLYDVDLPASRSRATAIPRVFKFLASLDVEETQRILDEERFSGPSRLGPIAEAIRERGRRRRMASG